MDAVASEISLIESSRRCAIHIFTQTRFLEVTKIDPPDLMNATLYSAPNCEKVDKSGEIVYNKKI